MMAETAGEMVKPEMQTDPSDAPAAEPVPAPAKAVDPAAKSTEDTALELAEALAAGTEGSEDGARLSVSAGDGSIVIDMTDDADFSMFELGSARPQREVIAMMERVAKALAGQPGIIEISGHTDARPFKGSSYDNWRLSAARAQMAYYMLVRAGIPESRIRAVTGHADRIPKNADDPLASENRRIAIRLVTGPDAAPDTTPMAQTP
jgi:chemotaxis protein MotB